MKQIEHALPFKLLGIDSDNGSEFMNYHLKAFCDQNKSSSLVDDLTKKTTTPISSRKLDPRAQNLGYLRYDSPQALDVINDLTARS